MDIITKAQQTAQRLHKDQKRKSGGLPYFTHLQAVAKITSQYTSDPEIIAAAYLHDAIEDTAYTIKEVIENFGERVASLVFSVSKDESGFAGYMSKINNKDSLLIAGADKLANSTDLVGVTDWSVFNFSPKEKVKHYREVNVLVRKYWPDLADRIDKKLSLVDHHINNPHND